MVAVLVLSIGLFGLAGLQLRTMRNNQSALERGVAVVEIHAIADAMRADRIAADNDDFNIALTDGLRHRDHVRADRASQLAQQSHQFARRWSHRLGRLQRLSLHDRHPVERLARHRSVSDTQTITTQVQL